MTSQTLTSIIVELPGEASWRNPALWKVFNADSGKQIITLTELHIWANADGALGAEGLFLDDTREQFTIGGFKITA